MILLYDDRQKYGLPTVLGSQLTVYALELVCLGKCDVPKDGSTWPAGVECDGGGARVGRARHLRVLGWVGLLQQLGGLCMGVTTGV